MRLMNKHKVALWPRCDCRQFGSRRRHCSLPGRTASANGHGPFLDLVRNKLCEVVGATTRRGYDVKAKAFESLPERRIVHYLAERRVEPADQTGRRALWQEHRVPRIASNSVSPCSCAVARLGITDERSRESVASAFTCAVSTGCTAVERTLHI